MKILVLGGAGYIGSILCPYLVEKGNEVTIFDIFLYNQKKDKSGKYRYVEGDICKIDDLIPEIEKADAIVNLAAISNDPSSDLKPTATWNINYKANETIANLCRSTNKRIIYASSCSVYGFSNKEVFHEESKLNPITLYAKTKMLSEKYYLEKDINGIVLRFATVYGFSEKPRFDLVVNTMIGTSFFNNRITVNGGDQWRPIVHVKDVCNAIYLALTIENPKKRIYNVGGNDQNYTIAELGRSIQAKVKTVELRVLTDSKDTRSYKVDFSKMRKDLGFKTKYSVEYAIEEFYQAFNNKVITNMADDQYYRVKYLKNRLFAPNFGKKLINRIQYRKLIHLF